MLSCATWQVPCDPRCIHSLFDTPVTLYCGLNILMIHPSSLQARWHIKFTTPGATDHACTCAWYRVLCPFWERYSIDSHDKGTLQSNTPYIWLSWITPEKIIYPPWNWHSPWKWMVGILLSYWGGLFSGAMLVSGRVTCQPKEGTISKRKLHLPTSDFQGIHYSVFSTTLSPLPCQNMLKLKQH